jgi:hypothetical protein
MSQQITTAFVSQFGANVQHLSQQKGSRLQGAVRKESQQGKKKFFDQLGTVSAVKRTGRHASTPQMDTPHARRMVTLSDYEWADLVDDQDKIRMLIDPTSEYALAAAWAFGRSKDDEIISASIGTAYTGEEGTTATTHPDTSKYAANDGSAFSNLNVVTLRAIKRMMDLQEVDPSLKRYIAVTPYQIESLLGQTQVTSSDYNTVKALAQGEVNSFMGFEFISLNRLNTTAGRTIVATAATGVVGSGSSIAGSNYRSCFAWAQDGLLLSVGEDYVSRISERDDKGYAKQVYGRMSIGSTRMEEVKVIEVVCKES